MGGGGGGLRPRSSQFELYSDWFYPIFPIQPFNDGGRPYKFYCFQWSMVSIITEHILMKTIMHFSFFKWIIDLPTIISYDRIYSRIDRKFWNSNQYTEIKIFKIRKNDKYFYWKFLLTSKFFARLIKLKHLLI